MARRVPRGPAGRSGRLDRASGLRQGPRTGTLHGQRQDLPAGLPAAAAAAAAAAGHGRAASRRRLVASGRRRGRLLKPFRLFFFFFD